MGAVKNRDIPEEYSFFGDLFNFRKKYYIPEADETFWEQLIEECDVISKKYNSEFANQMLLVVVDDIDRRFRQQTANPFVDKDPLKTVYERLKKK